VPDRSAQRDAAVREKLRPLAPGERPLGLRLAVVLAALVALANLVVLAGGWASGANRLEGLVFAAALALAAIGMWQRRYVAVLAFEALLGISTVYAALSLLFVSNLAAALLALAVIAVCAPVFWLLVRVMARLQAPDRKPVP
jgi:hypothetical protein